MKIEPLNEQERLRRLAKFNRELKAFALGQADEFRSSDGTVYRRLRREGGDQFERLSADGGRAVGDFTDTVRDWFLAVVAAESNSEIDAAWNKATGGLVPSPGTKDRRN